MRSFARRHSIIPDRFSRLQISNKRSDCPSDASVSIRRVIVKSRILTVSPGTCFTYPLILLRSDTLLEWLGKFRRPWPHPNDSLTDVGGI
jgi:hypothetical protein